MAVCTRGGNRSWNGVVKRFDQRRCDYLFVLVEDGRRWFIPSNEVGGQTGVLLGGPRYAAYEIDSGSLTAGSRLDVSPGGAPEWESRAWL